VSQLPQIGLYRRATAAALVVAPALLLVDNLIHPKEYTSGHEAEQLAKIADAYTRWQLAHVIGFFAILIFAVAILGLAFLVRRRQPRLGLAGGALALVGLLALAGVIVLDGFTWGVLGHVSGRAGADSRTVETALDEIQTSSWSLPFYLLGVAWLVGMIMLALGAARQRAVPLWAGALLAAASLIAGTEGLITSNAYFIAGAAALLAGGIAVGLAIARMSDEAFGMGGPGEEGV
jgi:hypothetical protein